MTDVIGTAAIDERPARRLPSIPRWVVLLVVTVVVVGIVVVPYERSHLADSAARWVQSEWSLRAAYDDARVAVIEAVSTRAGVLDGAVVDQAVAIADREESSALRRLADAIAQHHTWSKDVARARDAAVAALRLEVVKLDHDAVAKSPVNGYLFAPDLDRLLDVAAGRVRSMARAHHLASAPDRTLRLRPAQALLDRLRTPTDFATGMSLVITADGHAQIMNLDTGRRTALHLPRGDTELESWAGRIMVVSRQGVQAFDAAGRAGPRFTTHPARVLSATGPTVWLNSDRGVRRYADDGRPLTRWITRPPGRQAIAATGALVVLLRTPDEATFVNELWNPVSGSLRVLPRSCYGGWATAGTTLVGFPCAGDNELTTIDALTGRERHLHLPERVAENPLETVSPLSPADQLSITLAGHGLRPGLLDLRTGHLQRVPGDGTLTPAAWSADGRWVLLVDEESFGQGRTPQAALWSPQDGRRTSVRLSAGTELLGELPLLTTNTE